MFRPPHIESDQLYPHNTPLVLVNNTNNLATSMSCGLTSTVSTYHPPLFAVWKITACFSTLSPEALALCRTKQRFMILQRGFRWDF